MIVAVDEDSDVAAAARCPGSPDLLNKLRTRQLRLPDDGEAGSGVRHSLRPFDARGLVAWRNRDGEGGEVEGSRAFRRIIGLTLGRALACRCGIEPDLRCFRRRRHRREHLGSRPRGATAQQNERDEDSRREGAPSRLTGMNAVSQRCM